MSIREFGVAGDATDIVVKCETCGAKRPMSDAFDTDEYKIDCRGQVLYDLLARAKHRIFLVTFAAHRVPLLCEHLGKAIDRGIQVTLLLESEQASAGQLSFDASKAFKDVCLDKVRMLYWPLEHRERNQADKPGKLHVKCALIDQTAIVGSANLTDDAFNRNMEMGVIIKDPVVVTAIHAHFQTLERNGILKHL